MKNDTIVALATAAGKGGIAVVRVSGSDALPITLRHLSVGTLEPRRATYCRFDDLDDVVATYCTRGYTGEPTVEISCHGSVYIQQSIVQILVDDGARMAERGEFTMRAFRSGRLNLSQAEAVADLIDATTPAQHRLAVSQLRGGYAKRLSALRQQLVDLTSLLELELDFSQEDVEFADRSQLEATAADIRDEVQSLLESFALGNVLKHGVPVAIVGSPNVGKSTLLNALLDDDRAIVSDIPGTTRDTVEGMLTIEGVDFRLVDTAGLRQTEDTVERLGIERSLRAIEEAMIVVEVGDVSMGYDIASHSTHHDSKKHICVLNKCDMDGAAYQYDGTLVGDTMIICTSAKQGLGIGTLKKAMHDAVDLPTSSEILLSNVRHRDALFRVDQSIANVLEGLASSVPADLVAVDLREAIYHLGSITGEVTSNDLLSNIFNRFCVGK